MAIIFKFIVTFHKESYKKLMIRCPEDRFGVPQYIWKSRCRDGMKECYKGMEEDDTFTQCNLNNNMATTTMTTTETTTTKTTTTKTITTTTTTTKSTTTETTTTKTTTNSHQPG